MAEHVIIPSRPPIPSNTVCTHPNTHVQKPNVPSFSNRPTAPSNNTQPKNYQPNNQTTTVSSSKQHAKRTVPGDRLYSRAYKPATSMEVNSDGNQSDRDQSEDHEMIDLQDSRVVSEIVGCRNSNSNMHSSENLGNSLTK